MDEHIEKKEVTGKVKAWMKKHPILTVVGILIVIGIIGNISSGPKDKVVKNPTDNTKVEAPITKTETPQDSTAKQYQKVFSFNGNGIKKSEPFTISGDRFKIDYDCKGDVGTTLCSAMVYKVGSTLPQIIMNSPQSIKDSTVIYSNIAGKGEYYLSANTMGNFTMSVSDYR